MLAATFCMLPFFKLSSTRSSITNWFRESIVMLSKNSSNTLSARSMLLPLLHDSSMIGVGDSLSFWWRNEQGEFFCWHAWNANEWMHMLGMGCNNYATSIDSRHWWCNNACSKLRHIYNNAIMYAKVYVSRISKLDNLHILPDAESKVRRPWEWRCVESMVSCRKTHISLTGRFYPSKATLKRFLESGTHFEISLP